MGEQRSVWPWPARYRSPVPDAPIRAVIFDFDGTLVDSDAALVAAFAALGIDPTTVTFGHAIGEECERLGISVDDYAEVYDDTAVVPFDGVGEMIAGLGRWSLCSNKHPRSGAAELERLGWTPEVALFADAFDWRHKHLGPVLDALRLTADEVLMVGDSDGDRRCAVEVGCRYVWAGWNPRTAAAAPSGVVVDRPVDLLGLLVG